MFRIACLVIALAVVTNAYRRICYHSNWSQYRNSQGKFFPENINSTLCTHIIYAFATLNGNHLKAFEWNDESTPWSTGLYERFNAMKKQNPNVKTLLAVGGWNLGSAPFTRIAASDASRTDFATDAVKFLRSHDFDGLDFDWEYPANRGSPPKDKQNFVELVKKTRELFDSDAQSTGKPRLILSAATGAGKEKIETAYDFPQLIQYLDMINLMTYDLHGAFDDHTGHNSPLKAGPMDTGNDTTLNVEWAAHEYVKRGVPKSMLNIGMPLYGRSFTLKSTSNTGVNAPVSGGGTAGRYTGESGFLAYYEICKMIPTSTKHMIEGQEVPYIVKGNHWVGYDDQESLRKKVDFVRHEQYGGVMVWDLALDDFSGSCGEGKYPLLNAINDELTRAGSIPVITNPPTTTTVATTTSASGSASGSNNSYRRICYHSNWSQYRNGQGKFFPENINASLCTHIIYAFATLNGNHLKAFEWNDESTPWSTGLYERFNAIKKQNPNVKTLLAVGGWNLGSAPFTRIAASDATRTDFATDAVKFLRSHDFDGLDFDWEYPANRGSPPKDKQNFVELVKKTRELFDSDAQSTGKPRLILSAATGAGKEKIETAYDFPQLIQYLDMINLMTYDLHGAFDDHTGHNSPLKAGPMDTGNDTTLNVEWAAHEYIKRGVPKSMLNVGMPLYGRSFTLKSTSETGLNAPVSGGGNAGMYTAERGFLAYYEICKMIPTSTKHMIEGQEVPYIVKGNQWVGYDDQESLRKKVDFVRHEQYGGVMVWDLALDDFSGSCGEGKYPLLNAINDELTRAGPIPVITNPPPTTAVVPVSSTPSGSASGSNDSYRRICYHSNWSQYRNGKGRFFPENINASLCTHIIYAFATLNNNHLKAFEWNDESTPWSTGLYERFNALKKQNPNVKTMLAVGGWNLGSAPFTRIAASDATRTDFATDAVKFLRSHNFDGLDFDWEYPANRGSPPKDKQNFVELVKKTRELFDSDAQSTGNPRLILSAATGAGKEKIETAYDFPQLIQYLDMINLMTYDLHGAFDDHTGHNSPLKAGPMDTGNDTTLNVEWAAHEYVKRGVPKSMLNIGMPLYGRSFTLKSTSETGVNAPVSGGGNAGMYTAERGFLAYYEICTMIATSTKHMIEGQEVPYIVKGNQWVGYDDQESLRKKVDFVRNEHYGGVMVWDLALDDFSGSCGEGKYPLLNAINDELTRTGPIPVLTNPPPTTTVVPASTTSNSGSNDSYRRICYHSNWSQYRNGEGKFLPESINASLCTHIIYAFATLNNNHLKAFEWNDESTPWSTGMYERFNALKKQNPNVKTLLAVGGWNLGSAPFTRIAASDATRTDFATDAVKFLRSHDFDGLDFDWEYPANRGSPPQDKQNFVELVKKTRELFDSDAQSTGKPRLILSAATGAGKEKIETAYDFPQLIKYLDMINLMTYDLHGAFDDHTGHNSPLKAGPMDTGNDTTLNVEWAAHEYVRRGVPKSMLNVGMPLYGRSFTLSSTSNTGLHAPVRGGGTAGRFTRESGFLAYYEICTMIPKSTKHIIQGEEVPYIVQGNQWVGYDDQESLRKKVDFVKQEHFGGVMVWDLALDDFSGSCGEGKYPLLNAINDELRKVDPNMLTTKIPTLSPTLATNATSLPMSTAAPPNPQTPAPQTPAPQTPAPQTPVPQTPAPQTPAPQTPAPQTPAPQTPAPQTPAPQTPAPQTPAPQTPAPQTPAPQTPAPQTPAPQTPAPQTPAPQTPAPQTPAPQTPAPQTPAPLTPAPQTPAPQTPAPQTPAPQTPAPQTPAPQTPAPQTPAPQTPAPQTAAPQTAAPQTAAPQTVAPQTAAPQTVAPQTAATQTAAPQTAAPQTAAPQTVAPQTAAPQTGAPQTAAPQTAAPQTAAPQTSATQTAAPQTNAPMTSAPSTSSPVAHHTIGTTNTFNCASHGTGFYPSPADCSKYFICAGGSAFEVACTPGLLFNPISSFCDSPSNVQCNGAPIPPSFTQRPVVMTTSGTNAPVTTTPTTTSTTTPTTTSTTTPTTTTMPTTTPTTTSTTTPVQTTTQAPTPAPTPAPTQPQTTKSHNNQPITPEKFCQGKNLGLHSDPDHCGFFYECASGLAFHEQCSAGTLFNPVSLNCDYPQHVNCGSSGR
ncbi:probable chitinase 10 isoform X2 [Argopecten irradians]|uniref:probable chitinase 10 isoform X2 n=1 Tax=Argopecten irradians TaxID=31199 RepID=UPI00372324A2